MSDTDVDIQHVIGGVLIFFLVVGVIDLLWLYNNNGFNNDLDTRGVLIYISCICFVLGLCLAISAKPNIAEAGMFLMLAAIVCRVLIAIISMMNAGDEDITCLGFSIGPVTSLCSCLLLALVGFYVSTKLNKKSKDGSNSLGLPDPNAMKDI